MMKARLKMAMAAAEMLYSAAQECGAAGASGRGSATPHLLCLPPRLATARVLHPLPVSQVRTLRARDEIIPSEWHMRKGWGQDVHTT